MNPLRKLEIMLKFHQARVDAILLVMEELNGDGHPNGNGNGNGNGRPRLSTTPRGADAVLEGALAVDAARRQKRTSTKAKARRGTAYRRAQTRREHARAVLDTLKPGQTYQRDELTALARLGPYITNGYLKRKGDGIYQRTDKPFAADKNG